MVHVEEEHLRVLREILRSRIPEGEVWAFGSRVAGTHSPFSDLDLLLCLPRPLSLEERGLLRQALSESPLPFRVDVVEERDLDPAFLASLKRTTKRII